MRVGIIQSCYLPWRGFFDFIQSTNLFVLYDDIQYPQGRSFRNRNQLKSLRGNTWLTVPINSDTRRLAVDEVLIAYGHKPWIERHRALLCELLGPAPYFSDAFDIWDEIVQRREARLSMLNELLIRSLCEYLGIHTPIVQARSLRVAGRKTDRLLAILREVGATTYLSGPAAKAYIDEERFNEANIGLEYKAYDYPPYPQLWGPFEGAVTILDLIANCGPQSVEYVASHTANEVAVK